MLRRSGDALPFRLHPLVILGLFFHNIASQSYAFQKYSDYFLNYLPISPLKFLFFLLQ